MKRLFKWLVVMLIIAVVGACIGGAALWYLWSSNLPYIGNLQDYEPPIISTIYSRDGEIIGRFWEEKRIVIPLEQVPKHVIYAFVAAEDSRFFEHKGIDLVGILRALIRNVTAGKIEQGGSTITQQVTRSLLLKNTKRTYRRKAREALLSIQIEKNFSKERILFLYLNQIYLGHGAYGIEAAARTYFGKSTQELGLAEAAMLAGLPQAPARYSPVTHFDRAKARQRYVLQRMREEGYITKEEEEQAYDEPLRILQKEEDYFQRAPYFTEHVRKYLLKKYGEARLYRGGLQVYTTLNLKMQEAAQWALKKGLEELDKREGYRGPLRHLDVNEIPSYKKQMMGEKSEANLVEGGRVEALVEKVDDTKGEAEVWVFGDKAVLPLSHMRWARKPDPKVPYYKARVKRVSEVLREGDVILVKLVKKGQGPFSWITSLEQDPLVQGALLCMEPSTGKIRAMVGGRDFSTSQFNRAIQARRQPGSAFKPIIYAAALDKGMSPADVIMDAPFISDNGEDEKVWKPRNYKGRFFGPTILRTALAKSRNVITVKILKRIGIDYVISYARQLGIESSLNEDLSLALGSSGVSLLELTRAYCVFASQGFLPKPIFVERVLDRNGDVIEENQPESEQVISRQTAYVMTDLLKAVVQEGTGWRVKALHRPAAGKTGTTNDLRDAWFMGYVPQLVTGVWVGYDDQTPMGKGETGSRAASPIWLYFMKEALKDTPIEDFPVPEGVVFAKIDAETGLLASPFSKKTVFQAFREGTEPKEYSPRPAAPKTGQFLMYDMEGGS
ncbi:MAG TPA: penicillin-binding protein 1A [Desulfobacteraceae bacterium]|nr:penicillin-binding protein 1A [Deltaproteobacteria bacterium]HDM10844.1 penicillin-binding protein 1A [Desulfobacteraceae bacterium]